jgi:hypothetical protein
MKRVVIIGGGIDGLIASWVFSQVRGLEVKVLEPNRPGTDVVAGSRYIHRTDPMADMLGDLGVVYTNYAVAGGIMLHGKIEHHPASLLTMDKERAIRIQRDYYRKTRRLEPADSSAAGRAMNDPEAVGARKALRCDSFSLLRRLVARAPIVQDGVSIFENHCIRGLSGRHHSFDFCVVTSPLWQFNKLSNFELPEAMAAKLNRVEVDQLHTDQFAKWDYIYTPYTPEDLIHRVTQRDGGYTVEFSGQWQEEEDDTSLRLTNELNHLFPEGWALNGITREASGHLLPLPFRPVWPEHVRPIGRYAAWESRATPDFVLASVYRLAREWGLRISKVASD